MRATCFSWIVLVASLVAATAAAQSVASRPAPSQAPARDLRATTAGSATIRGRVLAGDRSQGIRRALVKLSSAADTQQWRAAVTDTAGRYEIANVRPGRYTLTAYKATYIPRWFGQRVAYEPAKTIDVADGQVLEGLDIALPRAAAICGRITDERGEPLESVVASAWQSQFLRGRRQLVYAGYAVASDDQGRYRIGGLSPGRYYVSVNASNGSVAMAQTYFPGTNDAAQAQPIVLKVGQEQDGIDFGVAVSQTSRVSGLVVSSSGRPLAGGIVLDAQPTARWTIGAGAQPEYKHATVQPDGRFTFHSMVPGEHKLSAAGTNAETGEGEVAEVQVTLTGSDVDGITLATAPGVSLSGRIRFDPDVNPGFTPSTLGFAWSRDEDTGRIIVQSSPSITKGRSVGADWSFAIDGVAAGARRLVFSTDLPNPWTLAAVFHGGKNLIDTGIDIRPGENIRGLEIVLTNRATEISGVVLDDRGNGVSDCQVVIFAEDSTLWFDRSRWLAVVRPDQKARFTQRGLPAGRYLAVAVPYLDRGDAGDPEVLARLRDRALRFTLSAFEPAKLELRLAGGGQ